MINLILFSYYIKTQCVCIEKIQNPCQLQSTTFKFWIVYQIQIEFKQIKIENEPLMTINSKKNHTIYYSYEDNQFIFQINEFDFNLTFTLLPGVYKGIVFKVMDHSLIKFVYDESQIKFRICLEKDFSHDQLIKHVLQSQYVYQQFIRGIDNNLLFINLWIKQIYQNNGLNQIELFSEFGQFFQYNFKEKYIKFGLKDLLKFQQLQLVFNCWFYFEIQTTLIHQDQFYIDTFIKSHSQEERKKLTYPGNYSFQNSIRLIHQNSIFSQFTIIQNVQNVSENNNLCEPDCETCIKGRCQFCKNNNKLEFSCICNQENMIPDENGICKYPANFLVLQEYLNYQLPCQKFGYHYDQGINECIPCFNNRGLPDIFCLYHKYDDVKFNLKNYIVLNQQDFNSRFKCQVGCDQCYIKLKKVICLLCQDKFVLIDGRCNICNIQHCAFCIKARNNKIICSLCEQFYSYFNNECIYSQEYQFVQIKQLLQIQYQQNLVVDQCEINNDQICIYCAENYFFAAGQCKPFNYDILEYYDAQSIYAQKPYQYFMVQRPTMESIESLNLRKIYFEKTVKDTIYFSQQTSKNTFKPNYYNQDLKKLSFCYKYENCNNFITLNILLVVDCQNIISLSFENKLYDNLDDILLYVENYDVYLDYLDIYITSNSSLQQISCLKFFQVLNTSVRNVQLSIKLNSTLLVDSDIKINSLRSFNMEGVEIKQIIQKVFMIKIYSQNIYFNNIFIRGPIQFVFLEQNNIIINNTDFQSPNLIVDTQLFLFLDSYLVKIIIQQSNFSNFQLLNGALFELYEQNVFIRLITCVFSNIILKQSIIIENQNLTSTVSIDMYQAQFMNLIMIKSQILFVNLQVGNDNNLVQIQFINFDQCKLNNSAFFVQIEGVYQIYQISNILINNSEFIESCLFVLEISTLDKFLFSDINILNIYLSASLFISLQNEGDSYFINISIMDLMGSIEKDGYFSYLLTNKLYMQNYSITNNNSLQFNLGNHIQIYCDYVYIYNYSIVSQLELILEINNDLDIIAKQGFQLKDLKYDQVIFYGQNLIYFAVEHLDVINIINLHIEMTLDVLKNKNKQQLRQNIIKMTSQNLSSFHINNIVIIIDFTGQINQMDNIMIIQGLNINILNGYFTIEGNSAQSESLLQFDAQNIFMKNIQFNYQTKDSTNQQFSDFFNQFYLIEINSTITMLQDFIIIVNNQFPSLIKLGQKLNQSKAIIKNIKIDSMSSFKKLILVDNSNMKEVKIQNIQMHTNSTNVVAEILQISLNSCIIIKNIYIKQNYNQNFQLLSIQDGHNVSIQDIIYFPLIGNNNQSIINIRAKHLRLKNIKFKKLTSQGMKTFSDSFILDSITIIDSELRSDLISINQYSKKETKCKLIMKNIMINNNILSQQSSLINIKFQGIEHFLMIDLLLVCNYINDGRIIDFEIDVQADDSVQNSEIKTNQIILFQNIFSLLNICQICFNFQNRQSQNIIILLNQNQYIKNTVDVLFKLYGVDILIKQSQFSNVMINQDSQLIQLNQSDKNIQLLDSQVILNQGVLYYKKNQKNLVINNTYIISYQDHNQQEIIKSQLIIPQSFKIQLSNNKLYLNLKTLSQNQSYKQVQLLFKDNNITNQHIYFPSGITLNGYKILKLHQRQYVEYLDHIYIYGYNEYNNVKLQINQCDLTTDNQNITITPNYINSTLLLSDIIFIGNPYLIKNFTLQVDCKYEELQLQLVIDSKIFKCQLGEILSKSKCQQCNIQYHLYSVKKHSQLCKLIDYDKIEDVQIGLIKLKQGYWRPYYSNDQIEHCQLNNCLGGWDVDYNSCAKGYIGPLCSECDYNNIRGDGYYSKYRQQCFECKYEVNYIYNILYIVFISLITLTITTRSQYLICQRYQVLICQNKYYQILNKLSIDQISVLIKQIQNYFFYLQFANVVFDVDLNLGIIVNTVSNPIQILNPQYDCIISQYNFNQQIIKVIFQIITPICILIIFYIIIIVINRYVKFKYFYIFIYTPILQFFIIYQIVICQSAISLLTYIQISGIKWIYGARYYQYFESTNIHLFISLAIVILIFAFIIPFLILQVLRFRQNRLYNKLILTKIGYLYQEYKSNAYFWEFFKMTSKLIFITFSLLYINQIKVLVSINSFYIFILMQCIILKMPYYLKNLNNYDTQFHLLFFTTFFCLGLLINIEQEYIKKILILIIYTSNILYFVFIIKLIGLKIYYNNPMLIDKLQQVLKKQTIKSLVQQKMNSLSKFQSAKKQIRSSLNRKHIKQEPKYSSRSLKTHIQSSITEKQQEIELIGEIKS